MLYKVIISVMFIFFTLGALDCALHNRLGLAEGFQRGFITGGKMLMYMAGYICLTPVIARLLSPVLAPFFRAVGADQSLFAGIILPCDTGGAMLAAHLAQTKEAGLFSGYIVGSVIGAVMVFAIPICMASLKKGGHTKNCAIYGLLMGILTSPVGMIVGGLVAGFSPMMMLRNLIPIVVFTAFLSLMLYFYSERMVKVFIVIGEIALDIAFFGITAAALEQFCGLTLIQGLVPLDEAFKIVGGIAIILAGAFPLLNFISHIFHRAVAAASHAMGISMISFSGLLATLANSMAAYDMINEMDDRGVMLNTAFSVAAAWVMGDQMGFTAQVMPSMLIPMMAAKLTAGIAAVIASMYVYKKVPNA